MSTQQLNFKYQVAADTVTLSSKQACRVVSVAALPGGTWTYSGSGPTGTLTAPATGTTTIDGVVLALGDRVLVAGEATGSHNGIYTVTTAGATGVTAILTRASDADTSASLQSCTVTISAGTAWAASEWIETTQAIVLDTTALVFTQVLGTIGAGAAGYGLAYSSGALHLSFYSEVHTTSTQAVTLAHTPNAILFVSVAGAIQDPNDYTLSTATVTFNALFPDGTETFIVYV